LPDQPRTPVKVIEELDTIGSPATVASAGGRFFGFVIGGCLPAALAANILAAAWYQNAVLVVTSPVGAALEKVCGTDC
jgi:xanthine/CO dehydrogenase XdhC/CoxF family maturation factor